jgi:hypothetical protein
MSESLLKADYMYADDLESNTDANTSANYVSLSKLKSILKKPDPDEDKRIVEYINFIIMIGIIVVCIPIIVCDFYFSCADEMCVNRPPSNLNITMKMYLILSACFNMILLPLAILNSYYFPSLPEHKVSLYILKICNLGATIINLASFTANIIGAVIFWGAIYGKEACSSNISTYIFIAIIVKFVANIRHAVIPYVPRV